MEKKLAEFRDRVKMEIEEIWVDEPRDIYFLKKGYAPSGAGIHNQYFTTTVMLSGEMRALGIHVFPDLLKFARSGAFTIDQLRTMTGTMLQIDLGVVAYFGLRKYGDTLKDYEQLIPEIDTVDDYVDITNEMFTLTNRYQLWLHQIFPWHLSIHFPKAEPEKLKQLLNEIERC